MMNDSQKTKSGLHAFFRNTVRLWLLIVVAGDALVGGEKLWLGEKAAATANNITANRLVQVVADNTPLASYNLIRYNTDHKIRYLKRQVH